MQEQRTIDHIIRWMRNYADAQQKQGWVVGVSGGIDSAVTSALCARSGLPTLCLQLPIHQAEDEVARSAAHTTELARRHANVTVHTIPLSGLFDAFAGTMAAFGGTDQRELALVNTKSRLRLDVLYYFATLHERLVVGTGNKVEQYGVGFFAKYGDGGMDISPLAGLLKSEVYALGRALHVDQRILEAPPTDGLWPDGRTDLDQIGATYPELEWAMDLREHEVDVEAMRLTPRQQEVLAIYDARHADNRHKVDPPPVCPIPRACR